jgi:hypothetical protein
VALYAAAAKALGSLQRLQQLHYDAASGHFADWGLHTEAVTLDWVDVPAVIGQPPQVGVRRGGASVNVQVLLSSQTS